MDLLTYFGCSEYPCLCVLVLPPPLLSETVNALLTRDLMCLADNMCVLKLICSDLCCAHLQVISVIPLHQTQLQGLYYCPPLPPGLEFLHMEEDLLPARLKGAKSFSQGPVVSLLIHLRMFEDNILRICIWV